MQAIYIDGVPVWGPYDAIEDGGDRYVVVRDGARAELPHALVGEGAVVSEWVGPLPAPAPEPAPVPQMVTMRQARLALLGAGLLDDVEAAIAALPEPQQTAARIEWDYSSEVHRSRPFVQQLAAAMGLTGEQLDSLFRTAAEL